MLKLILDSIDSLDAALKPLYTKGDDGKFHLDAEVEDVSGLKSALAKERESAAALTKLVKSWQALGKQPEEISAILEQQAALQREKDQLERQKAIKDGKFDEVLAQEAKKREAMAAKHQAELEAANGNANRYRSLLEQNLVEAQATAAIAEAKGVPQLLLPHIKGRVKVLEENGKFSLQILDAAGNPMVADAKGTPATFKELVESFKTDPIFGRAFEGTNLPGSGTPGNGGKGTPGGKTMARAAFNALSPTDQMKFSKAGGQITD